MRLSSPGGGQRISSVGWSRIRFSPFARLVRCWRWSPFDGLRCPSMDGWIRHQWNKERQQGCHVTQSRIFAMDDKLEKLSTLHDALKEEKLKKKDWVMWLPRKLYIHWRICMHDCLQKMLCHAVQKSLDSIETRGWIYPKGGKGTTNRRYLLRVFKFVLLAAAAAVAIDFEVYAVAGGSNAAFCFVTGRHRKQREPGQLSQCRLMMNHSVTK